MPSQGLEAWLPGAACRHVPCSEASWHTDCRVNHEGEFFTLSGSLLEPEKAEIAAVGSRPRPQAPFPTANVGWRPVAPVQRQRQGAAAAAVEARSPAQAAQPGSRDSVRQGLAAAAALATDAPGSSRQQPEHRKKSKRRNSTESGTGLQP